jgi:hypothetical protein
VCTQFIQGDVPLDPGRLSLWDEETEIFGGRPKLSTWLSPAVDNLINLLKINRLRFTLLATMRRISDSYALVNGVQEQGITSTKGAKCIYKIPKDD